VYYTRTYLPMKMEQKECSETSAYKFQTPGNHPKESIQHSIHGEGLKSRIKNATCNYMDLTRKYRLCHGSEGHSGASNRGGLLPVPGQSMWYL